MIKRITGSILLAFVLLFGALTLFAGADDPFMSVAPVEEHDNAGKYAVALDTNSNIISVKAKQPLGWFPLDNDEEHQWAGIEFTLDSKNYTLDGVQLEGEAFVLWVKCDESGADSNVLTFTLTPTPEGASSAISYTIKFVPHVTVVLDLNDGTDPVQATFEQGGAPDAPTREGYEFKGFYTDAACADGSEFDPVSGVPDNLTLYAKWEIKTYSVTLYECGFDVASGFTALAGKPVQLDYGSVVSPSSGLETYFVGWFIDEAKTQMFNGTVSGDSTLYAKYSAVSFYVKEVGSTVYTPWENHAGIPATQYRVPIQNTATPVPGSEYSFAGWYTDSTRHNADTRFSYAKGLQQQFPPDVEYFKLYAGYNGPSVMFVNAYNQVFLRKPTNEFGFVEAPTIDELYNCAVPSGYTVLYWVERETNGFDAVNPGSQFDFDNQNAVGKILRPFVSKTVWLVEFDTGDGGSAVPYQTIENGGTAADPGTPLRAGYTFAGYYKDNGSTKWNFNNKVNTDTNAVSGTLKLTAKWTPAETSFVINVWREKSDMPAGMDGSLAKATLSTAQRNDYAYYDLVASVEVNSAATESVQTQAQIEAAIKGKVTIELQKHNMNGNSVVDLGMTPLDNTKFDHATQPYLRGDGTTIVDAFYIRNIYKIEFHNVGTTANNNTALKAATLSGTYRSIYVKYEQNVTGIWPDSQFSRFSSDGGNWNTWQGRIGYMDWNTSNYCKTDWTGRKGTENGLTVDGGMQYILGSGTYSYVSPTYLKIAAVKAGDAYFIHEGTQHNLLEAVKIPASVTGMPGSSAIPKYISYTSGSVTDVFLHVYTSKYSNGTTNGHDIRPKGYYTYEALMTSSTSLNNTRNNEVFSRPKYSNNSGTGTYYYFYESLPAHLDFGFDNNNMSNVIGVPDSHGGSDQNKRIAFNVGDNTLQVLKELTGFTEDATSYVDNVTGVTYIFRGYYLDSGYISKIGTNATMELYNIIYTKWEAVPFTVTVTNGFGSQIGIVKRSFGDPMRNPSNHEFWSTLPAGFEGYVIDQNYTIGGKTYVFEGWEVTDGDLHYQLSDNMVAKRSYTLTAKWHSVIGSYWVEYREPDSQGKKTDGWNSPADTLNPYAEGAEIIIVQPPTPQIKIDNVHKEFAYWTDEFGNAWEVGSKVNIGGVWNLSGMPVDGLLYAKDKTNKQHGAAADCTNGAEDNCPVKIILTPQFMSIYQVVFDYNYYGEISPIERRFYEEWQMVNAPSPARTDYAFDGWYLDADCKDSAAVVLGSAAKDIWDSYSRLENSELVIHLYAKWKPVVEWRTSSGTAWRFLKSEYVPLKTLRNELALPPVPVNCVWYSDMECNTEVQLDNTQITAPLTLYTPAFTVNYYINSALYKSDGDVTGSIPLLYPQIHGKELLWKADEALTADWEGYTSAAEWFAASDRTTMTLNLYSQAVKVVYHIADDEGTESVSAEYRTIGETISRTNVEWFTDETLVPASLWDNGTILTDAVTSRPLSKNGEDIYELNLYNGVIELELTVTPQILYYTTIASDNMIALRNTVDFLVDGDDCKPGDVLEFLDGSGAWTAIDITEGNGKNVLVETGRDSAYRVKRGHIISNEVMVEWRRLEIKPLS